MVTKVNNKIYHHITEYQLLNFKLYSESDKINYYKHNKNINPDVTKVVNITQVSSSFQK